MAGRCRIVDPEGLDAYPPGHFSRGQPCEVSLGPQDGSFANSEGEVKEIREAADPTEIPKVVVVLTFWGRPLEVELDASQVEKV